VRLLATETDPAGVAMHAFASARLAFIEGRYAAAADQSRHAIRLLRACGAEVHCTFALRYAGRLAALRADHAAAIQAIQRALGLAHGLGLAAFARVLTTDLGVSLGAIGEFDRARALLEQPLASARE